MKRLFSLSAFFTGAMLLLFPAAASADVVALMGDPLEDFTLLENVPFVMKAGETSRQIGCTDAP